jgi:hypothetical protein
MALKKGTDKFLPDGYELPAGNSFMKFVAGKNKFRILSSLVTGYEYWKTGEDGKDRPVRSKEAPVDTSDGKKNEKSGKVDVNHFWAVVVYDYATESIRLLEITQKGIQKYILELVNNPDWGAPQGYDIVVTKEGEGLLTKYSTSASPHKAMSPDIIAEYEKSGITAESLFEEKE